MEAGGRRTIHEHLGVSRYHTQGAMAADAHGGSRETR
ncbi:ATP-dependent helicase HrpA [Ectothiorhodospira haloalkaliphila]|uniref:ATP-dependent helicase HrpA n=1 Tax=Ectothiorhodospira haloalkaliphila TaxID=421628 RepID=W8KKD5_9GAMM|nr:ATP-dependent helicase HrpA [Ectothiorhodospira haloalkaliphila]